MIGLWLPIGLPRHRGGLFSVALSVGRPRGHAARVYSGPLGPDYAALRPAVFGLSSPGEPGANLRPSRVHTHGKRSALFGQGKVEGGSVLLWWRRRCRTALRRRSGTATPFEFRTPPGRGAVNKAIGARFGRRSDP